MPTLSTVITTTPTAAAATKPKTTAAATKSKTAAAVTRRHLATTIPRQVTTLPAVITPSASASASAATKAVIGETVVVAVVLDLLEGRSVGTGDVDGLGAVVLGDDKELDGLALVEGAKAFGFDGGLVDEQILAAVVGLDEAEALVVVEPTDGAT